jgi:hypothetical protein
MGRKFLQVAHRIDQIVEELDEFKKALFNDAECGVSIKELYLRSNPTVETINLKQEYQNFPLADVDQFLIRLKTYAHYAQTFEQDEYLWRDRKPFLGLGIADLKEIEKILSEIPVTVNSILTQLETQV